MGETYGVRSSSLLDFSITSRTKKDETCPVKRMQEVNLNVSIICWGHVTMASYIEYVFPEKVNTKIVRKMVCRCSVPVIFLSPDWKESTPLMLTVGFTNVSYLLSMGEP